MQKNPHKYAKLIFNVIAPVYSALDKYVRVAFRKSFFNIKKEIDLEGKCVLDIFSGPGSWAALYKENGAIKVHGVDIATRMVKKAQEKYSPEITFSVSKGNDFPEFEDNSFDIVTASFVLHGMKQEYREKMLSEMQRISKKHIVINDFFGKTPFFIQLLEFLERSDYKHFKKNFCNELNAKFIGVKKVKASFGTSVYFAVKK